MRKAKKPKKAKLSGKARMELNLWKKADQALQALHAHLCKQPNAMLRSMYFDWSPRSGLCAHVTVRVEVMVDPKKTAAAARKIKQKLKWAVG